MNHDKFYLVVQENQEILEKQIESEIKTISHEFGRNYFGGFWNEMRDEK